MMLSASEEIRKIEDSAVNRFKMYDILKLWKLYDPKGEGFINYKDFWKFCGEIAIIFGVQKKDLLDIKNKKDFLRVLDLPVYESTKNHIFCYRFHDVLKSLCKMSVMLKYGVDEFYIFY